jgi:Tfp pilus assembly protein PilW
MSYRLLNKHIKGHAGTTLVEVMAVILISSVAIGGLVSVYVDSIRLWNRQADSWVMWSEAEAAMRLIAKQSRKHSSWTHSIAASSSDRLRVKAYSLTPGPDRIPFLYQANDKTMRWNDLRPARILCLETYSNVRLILRRSRFSQSWT